MSKFLGRFPELDDPAFESLRLDVDPAEFRDSKEEIGKGTCGTVYKVKLRGTFQAAKEFHPNFAIKGKNAKDKKDVLMKFSRCVRLRHNNIVDVFGIYEDKTIHPTTMVLMMELMDGSLGSLLDGESEISNSTKLSILLDVSSGLKYLHGQDPPIAHYYLSSSNVLLTAERKAKISDLGVAQLVTYVSEKKASQKAQAFMAPEIKMSKATFVLSADVFSFGVVMLHTITQKQLTVISSAQPNKQLQFNYRSQFDQVAADSFFCQLKEIVRSCLLSHPNRRPLIPLVSQVIENMTKLPDVTKSPAIMASSDHTESLTSHGHCEVQQTLEQDKPNKVVEFANQIKDSIRDKDAGLKNKLDEILQEYKKSFEETLQDVEQLQTKHLHKVKQLEEDQASQAIKFALESKSSNDEIAKLKTALIRNSAINKAKVNELKSKISMQSNTITQQEIKVEELKLTLKEREDSIQAAEVEHQQSLEQHKTKITALENEKKELQGIVTEKNNTLQKSEESKQAIEKKYLRLLGELEQAIVKEKEEMVTNQNTEIEKLKNEKREVHESSQATETEHHKPLEQHKKSDDQNNHHSSCGSQPVNDEQKDDDGSQKNSEQQCDKPQGHDGEQVKNDPEKETQQNDNKLNKEYQENQQIDGESCTKIKPIKDTQKESDTTGED